MSIPRGTTPINYFDVPVDLTGAAVIYLTYAQGGRTIIEKTIDDLTVTDDEISVQLTQEDTLAFNDRQSVDIQIRARFPDGNAVESDIMRSTVDKILKEGVI